MIRKHSRKSLMPEPSRDRQGAQRARMHRERVMEVAGSSGGKLDTATVLRVFLRSGFSGSG